MGRCSPVAMTRSPSVWNYGQSTHTIAAVRYLLGQIWPTYLFARGSLPRFYHTHCPQHCYSLLFPDRYEISASRPRCCIFIFCIYSCRNIHIRCCAFLSSTGSGRPRAAASTVCCIDLLRWWLQGETVRLGHQDTSKAARHLAMPILHIEHPKL